MPEIREDKQRIIFMGRELQNTQVWMSIAGGIQFSRRNLYGFEPDAPPAPLYLLYLLFCPPRLLSPALLFETYSNNFVATNRTALTIVLVSTYCLLATGGRGV